MAFTWIIVSDLTEEQILKRYPEEVKPYTPFVHMTREMYVPIIDYENNRLKFLYRDRKHGDAYGYEDGAFECYHPEMIVNPFEMDNYEDLRHALKCLSATQRRRVIKRFCDGMSVAAIADEENTTRQAVNKSIVAAINFLRKFLVEG